MKHADPSGDMEYDEYEPSVKVSLNRRQSRTKVGHNLIEYHV